MKVRDIEVNVHIKRSLLSAGESMFNLEILDDCDNVEQIFKKWQMLVFDYLVTFLVCFFKSTIIGRRIYNHLNFGWIHCQWFNESQNSFTYLIINK